LETWTGTVLKEEKTRWSKTWEPE